MLAEYRILQFCDKARNTSEGDFLAVLRNTVQRSANEYNMDQPTGVAAFPLPRVRRIIAQDMDISHIQPPAVFCMSLAVEYFLKEMTQLARKEANDQGRKGIHYKDVAGIVADIRELEFLKGMSWVSRNVGLWNNDDDG